MCRRIALVVVVLGLAFADPAAGQQQPQPPAPQPAQPPAPPQPQPPPAPTPVDAQKQVVVTWTLGDQQWDFKDVQSTYEPIGGVLDTMAGTAVWTFEIARDLLPGELILHRGEESPFKVVLLDAERVPLATGMTIKFSELSGKTGDRVKVTFVLPPAEVFKLAKTIRVERRTRVGFDTPAQPIQP